jgi:hypothetical protein
MTIFVPVLISLALLAVDSSQLFNLFKFILFYIFIILPASYVLATLLLDSLELTIFDRVILGYPATIGLYSAVFYVSMILESSWLLWMLTLVFAFVAIICWRNSKEIKVDSNQYTYFVVLYLLVAILFFASYSITTFTPAKGIPGLYYQDILWTVGNTWAIIREGFPVTDSRFDNIPFAYHMVQNVYLAMVSSFTGIDPFFLHLRIAPIYDLFFLVGVVYIGAKVFLKESVRFAIGLTFTFFFTAGAFSLGASDYIGHIYINPLSMFFGLSSFVALLFLISYHSLSGKVFILYTSLISLVLFASKASLVFSLLPSLIIYFIYKIIKGYRICYRDISLITIIGIILLILSETIYKGAGGGLLLHEYTVIDSQNIRRISSFLGQSAADNLAPFGFIIMPLIIILQAIITIVTSLYTIIFFLTWICSKQFREERTLLGPFFIFVGAITLSSVVWLAVFQFPGGRVYLIWYSVIAWIFPFYYSIYYLSTKNKSLLLRVLPLSTIFVGFFLFAKYTKTFFISPWWQASVGGQVVWDQRATISEGEWLAMQWIKNNLPRDVVLLSDRRGFFHESGGEQFVGRFFGYSALSGRQFFNEGDNFNWHAVGPVAEIRWSMVEKLLSSNDSLEFNSIWSDIPADYLIISKRFTDLGAVLKDSVQTVFENEDIVILAKP